MFVRFRETVCVWWVIELSGLFNMCWYKAWLEFDGSIFFFVVFIKGKIYCLCLVHYRFIKSTQWGFFPALQINRLFAWLVLTWSTFVNTSWKSILKLGSLRIFSRNLKSSDCKGRRKLEAFVLEKQLLASSQACMVFHTNPCKFRNFQWNCHEIFP